jgi:acyl-CoA thioester hydrolase
LIFILIGISKIKCYSRHDHIFWGLGVSDALKFALASVYGTVAPMAQNDHSQSMYRFFHPIQVRYIETDQQGHVFFGHYLTYFDVALTEYLKAINYSYDKFLQAGVDFFYVESLCKYHDRAFFDDILHVHVHIAKIGNSSFTSEFAIFEAAYERFVASGHIVAVAVDQSTSRPVTAPEGLRQAVARFEGTDA